MGKSEKRNDFFYLASSRLTCSSFKDTSYRLIWRIMESTSLIFALKFCNSANIFMYFLKSKVVISFISILPKYAINPYFGLSIFFSSSYAKLLLFKRLTSQLTTSAEMKKAVCAVYWKDELGDCKGYRPKRRDFLHALWGHHFTIDNNKLWELFVEWMCIQRGSDVQFIC